MVTVTRGDVALCDLNPVMGTEQAGVRPALLRAKALAESVKAPPGLVLRAGRRSSPRAEALVENMKAPPGLLHRERGRIKIK